jgi:hypothetical protein
MSISKNLDGFLSSSISKYILITFGIITLICAAYDLKTDIGVAAPSLLFVGMIIIGFSVILFLYHPHNTIKDNFDSLSTSSFFSSRSK